MYIHHLKKVNSNFSILKKKKKEIQTKSYFPPEFTIKNTHNTKEGNVYNLGMKSTKKLKKKKCQ